MVIPKAFKGNHVKIQKEGPFWGPSDKKNRKLFGLMAITDVPERQAFPQWLDV